MQQVATICPGYNLLAVISEWTIYESWKEASMIASFALSESHVLYKL